MTILLIDKISGTVHEPFEVRYADGSIQNCSKVLIVEKTVVGSILIKIKYIIVIVMYKNKGLINTFFKGF